MLGVYPNYTPLKVLYVWWEALANVPRTLDGERLDEAFISPGPSLGSQPMKFAKGALTVEVWRCFEEINPCFRVWDVSFGVQADVEVIDAVARGKYEQATGLSDFNDEICKAPQERKASYMTAEQEWYRNLPNDESARVAISKLTRPK